MTALGILSGTLLILVIFAEAFEALVLPRRITRPYRLTRLYYRVAWWAWQRLASTCQWPTSSSEPLQGPWSPRN